MIIIMIIMIIFLHAGSPVWMYPVARAQTLKLPEAGPHAECSPLHPGRFVTRPGRRMRFM